MAVDTRAELSLFLDQLAKSLDIPDTYFDLAEKRYKAIGSWLGEQGSELGAYKPNIYTQGSFRLGTVTKPISDQDDYDIDLVCCLSIPKEDLTQRSLKAGVGNRIKAHGTYGQMLDSEEGRRCWTLNYASSANFHMDILPALPDDDSIVRLLCAHGVPIERAKQALAITDNQDKGYDRRTQEWPRSNPGGYADWFKQRMIVRYNDQRERLAKSLFEAQIDAVPEHIVKTPLQQVIQILKRHRDTVFLNDTDDKPISIIITTLAAHAYNNEADLLDALINIVDGMPAYIQGGNGKFWVPNPVNPHENFADKWQEHPQREQKFLQWLQQVRNDFKNAQDKRGIVAIAESLQPSFGEGMIKKSLSQFSKIRPVGTNMDVAAPTFALSRFDVPHRQPPKWPIVEKGWVEVTGWASRDGFRPWQISANSALQKHCKLRFEARTNISRPYKVYWQVVNTGDEARNAASLRGEFYDGVFEKGGLVRNERTLYQGPHWVECFIVKENECIARSREFVINIK